jgi:CubicO group peptidase (beta-lactamase class C family)
MKLEDGFGMGIFPVPFYDKKGFGHTGGIDGFSSFLYTFPEEKISIALTSNGSRFNNNDIAIAALSDCFDKPFTLPSFYAVALTSADLDKYLGSYANPEIPIKIIPATNAGITNDFKSFSPNFFENTKYKNIPATKINAV